MDVVTHVLAPALFAEPIESPTFDGFYYPRWRERAAILFGAVLPDLDAVPGLLETFGFSNQPLFATYHRVASHSIPGLIIVALLAATIARLMPERLLLPSLRPKNQDLPRRNPFWTRLFGLATMAAAFHFLGDWITAWGTLKPLWPFSHIDVQLARVNSLEPVILGMTAGAWAVQHLALRKGYRKAGWTIAGVWLALVALYVILRPMVGRPAFV